MASSPWPVQVAAIDLLNADSAFAALVGGRVYDVAAPANATSPYVVFTTLEQRDHGQLMGYGRRAAFSWRAWAVNKYKRDVTIVAGHIVRVLDGTTLTVTDGAHTAKVQGECFIVTSGLIDPDGVMISCLGQYVTGPQKQVA